MLVVTAGADYIDIDAYASMVAYAELLKLTGKQAAAVSTAVWNESITKSIRALPTPLIRDYKPQPHDRYILVDRSDPVRFDKFVDPERVVEVFDHHPGFEDYWAQRLGEDSRIETIGATATLIYERWEVLKQLDQMSRVSAELLAAAIIDNTLNFQADVTTDRDRQAYRFLSAHAALDEAWVTKYFSECQAAFEVNLSGAMHNDTQVLKLPGLSSELCVGQIVVWDARPFMVAELETISQQLSRRCDSWLANIVSISEGRSYFLTTKPDVQAWLSKLLVVNFKDNLATANRMWLRKEIMKRAQG